MMALNENQQLMGVVAKDGVLILLCWITQVTNLGPTEPQGGKILSLSSQVLMESQHSSQQSSLRTEYLLSPMTCFILVLIQIIIMKALSHFTLENVSEKNLTHVKYHRSVDWDVHPYVGVS